MHLINFYSATTCVPLVYPLLSRILLSVYLQAVSSSPDITRFCFASETCVPIWPLETTLSMLSSENSWLNYQYTANNGYATQYQVSARVVQCRAKRSSVRSSFPLIFSHSSAQTLCVLSCLLSYQFLQLFPVCTPEGLPSIPVHREGRPVGDAHTYARPTRTYPPRESWWGFAAAL